MSSYLGEFEKLLLFALLGHDDEADGASVRRRIEERTGRVVAPGAVYTAMDRLRARSFVGSRVVKSAPEQGGRRRKLYRLLPAGAKALDRSVQALESMSAGLDDRLAAAVAAADGDRGQR